MTSFAKNSDTKVALFIEPSLVLSSWKIIGETEMERWVRP